MDEKKKMLVSEYVLLAGIGSKAIEYYLDKYMSKEMFQNEIIKQKTSNETPKQNTKSDEINRLVNEIYDLLPYYYDDEESIKKEVNNLIDKYNKDVKDSISKEEVEGLTTKYIDKDLLYSGLIHDLNDILNRLKTLTEKYMEYTKMLALTRECISVLTNSEEIESDDDLTKNIETIKKIVFPYLEDKNKENKLLSMFKDYEKGILTYLKDEPSKIGKYETLEEFKLAIRKELQDYLLDLSKLVKDKDLVKEIQEGYQEISEGIFKKSNDDYVNYWLDDIQKIIDEIKAKGTEKEIQELQDIIKQGININGDLNKSLDKVVALYRSLYSILIDIQKREQKKRNIEDYTISIDISSKK